MVDKMGRKQWKSSVSGGLQGDGMGCSRGNGTDCSGGEAAGQCLWTWADLGWRAIGTWAGTLGRGGRRQQDEERPADTAVSERQEKELFNIKDEVGVESRTLGEK
jgi:hypothetical protein